MTKNDNHKTKLTSKKNIEQGLLIVDIQQALLNIDPEYLKTASNHLFKDSFNISLSKDESDVLKLQSEALNLLIKYYYTIQKIRELKGIKK